MVSSKRFVIIALLSITLGGVLVERMALLERIVAVTAERDALFGFVQGCAQPEGIIIKRGDDSYTCRLFKNTEI
jgi:hypothetical protein